MSTISLKFDTIDQPVDIELHSGTNAEFFKNFLLGFDRPADRIQYQKPGKNALSTFLNNARKAIEIFKFDWDLNNITQNNFNKWHRDIEVFDLSNYPPWSQEKGDFFIDLHESLHAAERSNVSITRDSIKIKWFENSVPWPEIPEFKSNFDVKLGDVITDYPYVGKLPWTCYQNNDSSNLTQCCRLPDACPPGFYISLRDNVINEDIKQKMIQKRRQQLSEWYQQNLNQLESLFTQDQMLAYDGSYCVGRLKNIEQISVLKTATLTSVSIVV